ncbi:MAG TPA: SHOCT domain-containing protein [Burkholderiaceae bacterium]|nr:SHOCT domain-containing protein [Burkholderiaceae bacterium]
MFSNAQRRLLTALLMLACGSAQAQSDPGSGPAGRAVHIVKDSAVGRVVAMVYDGRDSYVRIETREPGAPLNQQPVSITPQTLRELLMRVELPGKGNEPVFISSELDEIVPPLAQALARALPEQDVSFAVSGRHALGGLAPRSVTTARVFYIDGRLNLIFGLVRADWENEYRGSGYLIPFEPGKRESMVDRNVRVASAGGAVNKRPDWIVIDPFAAPPPAIATPEPQPALPTPAVVIPAQPPAPAAPAAASRPAPAPAAPAATAPATAAPAAVPPTLNPPAVADSEALYRQTSERLKALQKLRDTGVITEEEYQQKRREILKGL